MPNLLIRDLDRDLLQRLKAQAKRHGRSVQSEVKDILQANVPLTPEEVQERFAAFRAEFAGRTFSDSAELIREDRER